MGNTLPPFESSSPVSTICKNQQDLLCGVDETWVCDITHIIRHFVLRNVTSNPHVFPKTIVRN